MKKRIIITGFILLSINSISQEEYLPEIQAKIKQVENTTGLIKYKLEGAPDQTIADRMKFYNVKGLSVAIINDYKIEWAKGYGWADEGEQRPVTTQTLFEPGSISKSLNAIGVLKLVQDKKIRLDKDINSYLTSWKFPYDSVSKNKKINIANLLSHTAGLSVHGFPGYYIGDTLPSLPALLDGKRPANTAAVRSLFEPGLKFMYSGGGTIISQLIIEDVARIHYNEYMNETVFKPLNMQSSFFTQPPPQSRAKFLATGYSAYGKEIKGKYPILVEQAAGGLWTTPTDLCRFILEIQLSLKDRSNKILSKQMVKKMLKPFMNQTAALGFFIEKNNGVVYFQHGAANQGFSGQYYGSMKNGNGIVVFINSDGGTGVIHEVIAAVANVYKWKGFYTGQKPETKKSINVCDSITNKYLGAYKQGDAIVSIIKRPDGLYYLAGAGAWRIYFDSDTTFFSLESTTHKSFIKNKNGTITEFTKKTDTKNFGMLEKIPLFDLPASLLNKYQGKYSDGALTIEVIKKQDTLEADFGNGEPTVKLNFISETDFYIDEDFGTTYKFTFNTSKSIDEIMIKSGELKKIMLRLK